MFLRTLVFSFLFLAIGSISFAQSQNFQATIKAGSIANSVKAVIRPTTTAIGQISSVQLTFLVPTSVGAAPTASILNNTFISGINYVQFNATEVTADGAYYVYTFDGVGSASVPTLTFTANAEYDLLEIAFEGRPGVQSQVRLAQIPLGGTVGANAGNYNFYLALNGQAVVREADQFYGTNSFDSGLGYNGYGYALVSNIALPLKWLGFSASKTNNSAILKWEVVNEVNNDYFEIQGGKDAQSLVTLGRVNATSASSYSFTDAGLSKLQSRYAYYRIKQVDKDGNFSYSDIKKITVNGKDLSFGIISNPVIGSDLKISIESPENNKGTIRIFDLHGKQVYQGNLNWNTGYSEQLIKLPELSQGTYIVNLVSGADHLQSKFVK